ncbi:MAG: SHD1 domain-containing protein [Planctomycetota bacterium]
MTRRRNFVGWVESARLWIVLASSIGCASASLSAEVWSDVSGRFTVRADYVGVEDGSVILKRADGSEVRVPIGKLSVASRDLAKRLYEAQKAKKAQGLVDLIEMGAKQARLKREKARAESDPQYASTQLAAWHKRAVEDARDLPLLFDIQRPKVSEILPLPTYPLGRTLEETMEYLGTQIRAGHPEVTIMMFPK